VIEPGYAGGDLMDVSDSQIRARCGSPHGGGDFLLKRRMQVFFTLLNLAMAVHKE
jgi:hypothetical protein